ncbi:MAG TPA: methyl-accepting chemotaxis protein [Oligoflexus sp.]|nr:methyl-accepting chemotaxis protein [Oligoflexus sp.]
MNLKKKLIVSFLAAAGFTLVVGVLGIVGMTEALNKMEIIKSNNLPAVDYVWRANQTQTEVRSMARAIMAPELSLEDYNRLKKDFNVNLADMFKAMKDFGPLAESQEEKDLLNVLNRQIDEWNKLQMEAVRIWDKKEEMIRDGVREKNPEAYAAMEKDLRKAQAATGQIYDESTVTLVKLTDLKVKLATDYAAETQKSVSFFRYAMVALVFVALAISLWIGFSIAQSTLRLLGVDPNEISELVKNISVGDTSIQMNASVNYGVYNDIRTMVKGLNDKANQAEAIAAGDLTKEIVLLSDRDRLGKSFQTMSNVLREVITRSNFAANQVSAGSDQVSSASQSLSQGAAEQAAAVEEITSSVTEISSKIKINADAAINASETAQKAQKAAEQGNVQIEVTLKSMTDINSSSREISKIIKVIDDIAFQTNLLALNAAVEAARAGRHGKGFAVVADEVRNLAGRSAKAAKETTELIESSSRKVESGLIEAKKTAESFKDIVAGSLQVASTVRQIADASKEQAAAISQIASGINQINKVTQTTTASAEETASAAEELAGQSQELKRSLAYFRIGDERSMDRHSMSAAPAQGRVVSIRPSAPTASESSDWGRVAPISANNNNQSDSHPQQIALDDQNFGNYRA